MKLIKITKVEDSIFEIEYRNFWGVSKTKRIYPYLNNWRWCDTGKEMPFFASTSVANLAQYIQIKETKYFNTKN